MELIEKLKEVENFFEKTNDKESKEAINEAIALLEKQRVSAEEVEEAAKNRFIGSDDIVNYNLRFGFIEGAKWMHDYATNETK
jgi:hypothetical protein